ncbi:MAG: phosphate ABC transporter permease PstA [Candidatus Limnocylindria bacterium]
MTSATTTAVTRPLTGKSVPIGGVIFQLLLLLSLLFALAVLGVLVIDVVSRGMPVFADRGADFLTSNLSTRPAQAGILQGIVGTMLIAVLVALIAFPLGVMTAIYLEEYAPDNRVSRLITINIRNLAGVPSVVYGLLGLAVFVPLVAAVAGGTGRNIVTASITLAVLVLPIVIITASEALRAVPRALREGGYGVGASRWEVTRLLVLPAAFPGILTGTVLSLSRALGETAPLVIIGASTTFFSTGDQSFLQSLFGSFTALPVIVFGWSTRPQEDFRALTAAAIVVLLIVTLFANTVAILLRNKYERTW